MTNIIELITGGWSEKRRWKLIKRRAKALPRKYSSAYKDIQKYVFTSTGVTDIDIWEDLLDLFEENAAAGRDVLEITGKNVAKFADELAAGRKSYFDKWRNSLNDKMAKLAK